ncbi:MAG: hypothetical protein RIR00_2704, partial [Pseudomonadota bacterium]
MSTASLVALKSRIQTLAPGRVVTRSYADFADRSPADLAVGVFTILSLGETSYPDEIYEPGRFGVRSIRVVGQILLAEDCTGEDIEAAEESMMDDIRVTVQDPLPADLFGLALVSWQQSGQLDKPYGWVAA